VCRQDRCTEGGSREEEVAVTLHLCEDVVIHDEDIHERFVHARGSGSKNLHHKATAVEVRYDVVHADLPEDVRARLLAIAGRRVTSEGELVITSRASVSQQDNRETARQRLVALVMRAARPVAPRKRTRPRRAVRARRLAGKRTHGDVKRRRHMASAGDDL
jgi:ribosome-associated protein